MTEKDKIIIVGAGTVGRYISDILQQDQHEVVVIDNDKERLETLGESLDIQTLQGHGADPAILTTAGIGEAQLLLALTNLDEVNLLSCLVGKSLGAGRSVARARSPWCLDNSIIDLPSTLQIDLIMNPEHLTALEIVRFLDAPYALALARYAHDKVQLRTCIIEEDSECAGQKLMDCRLPDEVLVVVLSHEDHIEIPTGGTILAPGAKITIMGATERLPEAQRLFHSLTDPVRDVTIAGGGITGLFLAETLERRNFSVKLIESNLERCNYLSERLDRTQVVHGDATQSDLMKEERIPDTDVFISVTGDDENNLMSCLLAKELGVAQTVVNIARPDYASLVQKFGISLALSPRNVMAERILTLVSRGRIQAVTLLEDGKVEVIEMVVGHGSSLVGVPLARLSLPEGTLISAIVRLGETIIPRGHHQIEPGDTVVVVGLKDSMDQLEAGLRGI